jgi:hypothetical protein
MNLIPNKKHQIHFFINFYSIVFFCYSKKGLEWELELLAGLRNLIPQAMNEKYHGKAKSISCLFYFNFSII